MSSSAQFIVRLICAVYGANSLLDWSSCSQVVADPASPFRLAHDEFELGFILPWCEILELCLSRSKVLDFVYAGLWEVLADYVKCIVILLQFPFVLLARLCEQFLELTLNLLTLEVRQLNIVTVTKIRPVIHRSCIGGM